MPFMIRALFQLMNGTHGFQYGGSESIRNLIEMKCSLLIRNMFYETGWLS